jgi:hypothetical protein
MTFEDSEKIQSISMYLLQNFYLLPYETNQDFYPQFYARLAQAREALQQG